MPTDAEHAEAVALAHMMGYADGEAAARAKVERLEAENKGLRKDNLELVNSLEGEGHRLERVYARVAELEAALEDYAIIENEEGNGQCLICGEVEDHKPDCLLTMP